MTLTKSISRVARNTAIVLEAIRETKELGVEVFFEKENIRTLDSKGEVLLSILSSLAHDESRSISGNSIWMGIRRRFEQGTLHINHTKFLGYDKNKDGNLVINEKQANRFGDGPNWRMRVVRAAGNLLGFDSDFLLKHSFKRRLYAIPLVSNYKNFLNMSSETPEYVDYPLASLTEYWKKRWLSMRLDNCDVINNVLSFKKEQFTVK